jgi:hypothetical protein
MVFKLAKELELLELESLDPHQELLLRQTPPASFRKTAKTH